MRQTEHSWQRLFRLAFVTLLLTGCGGNTAPPIAETPTTKATIAVAAAADLKFAFEEVIAEFQKRRPEIEVKPTFGSSGSFFAQLTNQAPFDMYLSADVDYPRKLVEQGQAIAETEFPYAVGHLVVWAPNDSPLDVEQRGIQALADPGVRKIAIANPKFAPYGRAAEAALKHFELYDAVKDRLVFGENVSQTAQFVESGAADVGIIALSLALSPALKDKGRFWPVPLEAHPPLEQGGVILSWTKHREACEELRSFLSSDSGREILRRYGFELPGE